MGHTNETVNYQLPQFIGTDKPSWLGDVNNAFLAIDTAIAEAKTEADSAAGGVAGLQTTVGSHTTQIGTLTETVTAQGGTLNTVTALIGNGEPTTTDKTLIGAINELHSDISAELISVDSSAETIAMTYDGYFTKTVTPSIPAGYSVVSACFINASASAVVASLDVNTTTGVVTTKFFSRLDGDYTFQIRFICKKV